MTVPKNKWVVLLAEDDPDHADLSLISLLENPEWEVHHVKDGMDCLAFLAKEGEYRQAPDVDCLLLDYHLPRINGQEVLQWLAGRPSFRPDLVLITTTFTRGAVVERLAALPAEGLITKPVDARELAEKMRSRYDETLTGRMSRFSHGEARRLESNTQPGALGS